MPTILSHALVPLSLGIGLGQERIPRNLLLTGVFASMLPDLDVLGFKLGVSYGAELGHRGASHSLFFALIVGFLVSLAWRTFQRERWICFSFTSFACASHGLLDTLTNGGLGAALFWPFSPVRVFAPVRVIQVSPIGSHFFSERALPVLASEFIWIALPALACCLLLSWCFRRTATTHVIL